MYAIGRLKLYRKENKQKKNKEKIVIGRFVDPMIPNLGIVPSSPGQPTAEERKR